MTAPEPDQVPDLTWKLALEDTWWLRFPPTFVLWSYRKLARKAIKSYRATIRDWMNGVRP